MRKLKIETVEKTLTIQKIDDILKMIRKLNTNILKYSRSVVL